MNKKNRLYLSILFILVVLFLVTRMGNKAEVRKPFFNLEPSEVSAFEIASSTDTLKVVSQGEDWLLDYPIRYPVQQTKMDDFLEKVIPVLYSRTPLSESEASHDDFNVSDSLGTHLKIWDKDEKLVAEVVIGGSDNYHYANARKKGEDKVYQLLTNISYNLNPQLSMWRDKKIVSLEKDRIRTIAAAFDSKQYTLTAKDTIWVYESGKESLEIKPEQKKLQDIITSLGRYQASDFIDFEFETYEQDFAEPVLEIMIETYDNETIHLAYVETDENRYLVQKDKQTDHLFVVYKNLVEKFMLTKSDFE